MPWVRQSIQLFLLLVIILSPITQVIRTYTEQPFPYHESAIFKNETVREHLDEKNLSYKNILDKAYDQINGGAYSIKLFGLKIPEPLTAIIYSVRSIFVFDYWNIVVVISLVIIILIIWLFGRVYCGYVCPWALLVNANLRIQKKLFKRSTNSSASMLSGKAKWKPYYALVLLVLFLVSPWLLQFVLPAAMIQHGWSDYILFGQITTWAILLTVLLVFEISYPAFYCRNLCPTGLFLSYVGRFKVFRLGYEKKNKCETGCELCDEKCWLGLNPKSAAQDPACDLCSRCIKVCPTNRLKVGLSKSINVSIILLAVVLWGCNSTTKPFGDSLVDMPIYENERILKTYDDSTSFSTIYGFVLNEKTLNTGKGKLQFGIHFIDGTELYNKEIMLEVKVGGKLLNKAKLDQPNFPISVGQSSVYGIDLNFEPKSKYEIIVSSMDNDFEKFIIHYQYSGFKH